MGDKATDRTKTALRAKLGGGGLVLTWFTMGSVPLLELATREGCDLAVIDLQHGLWDRMAVHLAARAAAVPILVRTADDSPLRVGEALDSGAAGILIPSIATAEQARAAVSAARYPPHGVRSGGGVYPLGTGFEHYYAHANDPLLGLMIESVEGVANAKAIAALAGVDFLFIGTGDLSLSIGCFPKVDERLETACRQVLDACRSVGKPCGIFTGSLDAARRRLAEGYAVVVSADDVGITKSGFGAAAHAMTRQRQ